MQGERNERHRIKCVSCGAEYWTIAVESKPARCKECGSQKINSVDVIKDIDGDATQEIEKIEE